MKTYAPVVSFLLLLLALYTAFSLNMPSYPAGKQHPEDAFSVDRALEHVEAIAREPHAVGFPAHARVRDYLLGELEQLGLDPSIQEGHTAGDWGNYSWAENILARIKGSGQGKALLLLSHYDSNPHSSYGASDAGSGVATLLEGLRAFLATNKTPENDIILLFSDAEELGLNGADLFVNAHPWAADVGLVLNFEARGSGGPSYMLIETNRGNSRLVEEFMAANPQYPVANSLAYSIYKMLPNDTDLTVFREDRDIEGFNFAFIDDHFDYHTALDNYKRLDRNTLAHQGSYLMPLLRHFSRADLGSLKSLNDAIYFNVPFFGLIAYPYDWIWPMFAMALLGFLLLLGYGLHKKKLNRTSLGLGMIPMLLVLLINGGIGYVGWSLLKGMYPQYRDILHGFPYNGHAYIAAFSCVSIAVCFWVYNRFRKLPPAALLPGPIVVWLAICGGTGIYLPGASFLLLPGFGLLAGFLVVLNQKDPPLYVLAFLSVPALWILGPFIQMFPVGLGLGMLISTTLLSTLLFLLLLPIFGSYKAKATLAALSFLLFSGFMVNAHLTSGFNKDRPAPSSLLYLLDADTRQAQWVTYDQQLSAWTSGFIKANQKSPDALGKQTISSKYGTGFTFAAEAPVKEIKPPTIEVTLDTLIEGERVLSLRIVPERPVNRLEVYTNETPIRKAAVNGLDLSAFYLARRKSARLFTHYISKNEETRLQLTLSADSPLELTIYEASNDLLSHPQFSIPPRPEDEIPKPFVLNDAILITKTLRFE